MDRLVIHCAGDEFWGCYEKVDTPAIGLSSCPHCNSTNVDLRNQLTPCYHLECLDCGERSPRAFAPEWDGRPIKTAEACKALHISAQAAARAAWPVCESTIYDFPHVWQVAMQVAISLCERIHDAHQDRSDTAAQAAARCAQEVKSWQEISPSVIAMLLRTSGDTNALQAAHQGQAMEAVQ